MGKRKMEAKALFRKWILYAPTEEQLETAANAGNRQSMEKAVRIIKAQTLLKTWRHKLPMPVQCTIERVANAGAVYSMKNAARAAANGHDYWCDETKPCPNSRCCFGCSFVDCYAGTFHCRKTWKYQSRFETHSCDKCPYLKRACESCMKKHVCP